MTYTEEEMKFVKECLEKNIPKNQIIGSVVMARMSQLNTSCAPGYVLDQYFQVEELFQLVFRG